MRLPQDFFFSLQSLQSWHIRVDCMSMYCLFNCVTVMVQLFKACFYKNLKSSQQQPGAKAFIYACWLTVLPENSNITKLYCLYCVSQERQLFLSQSADSVQRKEGIVSTHKGTVNNLSFFSRSGAWDMWYLLSE